MTGRPKDPKTARNKNVLVIGGQWYNFIKKKQPPEPAS